MLGVHFVLRYVLYLNGSESAEPHVQRNVGNIHAHSLNAFKHFLCKVKPRGRRGGRARVL